MVPTLGDLQDSRRDRDDTVTIFYGGPLFFEDPGPVDLSPVVTVIIHGGTQ